LLKKAASKGSGTSLSSARAAVLNITTRVGSIDDNTSGGRYAYRSSKVFLHYYETATKTIKYIGIL